MTETSILDERAVSEIEARDWHLNGALEKRIALSLAERDALIATLRHFEKQSKAKSELLEIVAQHAQSQLEQLRAESERLRKDRDELSNIIEVCHVMLDAIDPDHEEGTTSLDPLDMRLRCQLFSEDRITDDMVNGDD